MCVRKSHQKLSLVADNSCGHTLVIDCSRLAASRLQSFAGPKQCLLHSQRTGQNSDPRHTRWSRAATDSFSCTACNGVSPVWERISRVPAEAQQIGAGGIWWSSVKFGHVAGRNSNVSPRRVRLHNPAQLPGIPRHCRPPP